MLAAIRAGMDPQLAAAETRKIQGELANLAAAIRAREQSNEFVTPLTEVRFDLPSAALVTSPRCSLLPIEQAARSCTERRGLQLR